MCGGGVPPGGGPLLRFSTLLDAARGACSRRAASRSLAASSAAAHESLLPSCAGAASGAGALRWGSGMKDQGAALLCVQAEPGPHGGQLRWRGPAWRAHPSAVLSTAGCSFAHCRTACRGRPSSFESLSTCERAAPAVARGAAAHAWSQAPHAPAEAHRNLTATRPERILKPLNLPALQLLAHWLGGRTCAAAQVLTAAPNGAPETRAQPEWRKHFDAFIIYELQHRAHNVASWALLLSLPTAPDMSSRPDERG